MKLENIEIELQWPSHINISDLRTYIIGNFPKGVEIIRWYIIGIKILNQKKRQYLIKINASILN